MGTVEAGKLFLEALTCAGEAADLNAAGNFDTTYAAQASCVQLLCLYAIAFVSNCCSCHAPNIDFLDTICLPYSALNGLKDIRASSGCVLCTLPVTKRVQNRYNTLHGGCIGAFTHTAHIIISPFSMLSQEVEVDARVRHPCNSSRVSQSPCVENQGIAGRGGAGQTQRR